jgi:hypothetical protein
VKPAVAVGSPHSYAMSFAIDQLPAPSASGANGPLAAVTAVLAAIRRQTRRWVWIESLAWLGLLAAGFFWITLLVDRGLEPPAWVRAAAGCLGTAGVLWIVATKLVGRLLVPLSDEALALVVERCLPGFRDSLATAIGLARRPRDDIDPGLLARTTNEAAAMLAEVRPAAIFQRRRLSLFAFAGAAAVASIGVLAILQPSIPGIWARRVLALSETPWPRRVQLEPEGFTGGVRKVARGTDVDVLVRALASGDMPEIVELRWRGGHGWKTDRMGTRGGLTETGQTFGHVLKGVVEDTALEVRGGDHRIRGLRLEVVDAPALESLTVVATLPDYLGGGRRELPASRVVQIPRGARVRLTCRSTKPLSGATVAARSVAAGTDEPARDLATLAAPAATNEITAEIPQLDADTLLSISFTDTDGLSNREPIGVTLAALADEIPQAALRLRGVSTVVTARGRLPLEGTVSDDHGLADAAVHLVVTAAKGQPDAGPARTLPIARVQGGEPLVEFPAARPEVVPLEPLGLAPGGRVEVSVVARDRCTLDGQPQSGRSETWTLDVVTPEQLQSLLEAREIVLRRRYEAAIDDLSQAREGLAQALARPEPNAAAAESAAPAARFGEATSRATGETTEIAAAFREIRDEFDNNALLTPELQSRLVTQIADPLATIATRDLPGVSQACRAATARPDPALAATVLRRADEVLARMRAVLDKMLELESFNEVIERLRGVIRTQEEIRAETLERQKKRAREALGEP